MYLEGVGIRKQGLDVGKVDACIKVWQLMPAVCTNEVQGEKYLFWDKKLR